MPNLIQNYTAFLRDLDQNNNKIWFDQHRNTYKSLHEDYKNWIGELIPEVAKFDERLRFLTPSECTFRINRDYRFSKDKSPYKTHLAGGFSHNGKAGHTAGYYFEINCMGRLMVGGGQYWLEPDVLFRLRREIASNPVPLQDILEQPEFISHFGELSAEDRLKTCPKGFDKNSPAIELLKYKNYIAMKYLDVSQATDDEIKAIILDYLQAISELVKYLRSNG
jgi:uncharacterized protein (TIGR02453 family)